MSEPALHDTWAQVGRVLTNLTRQWESMQPTAEVIAHRPQKPALPPAPETLAATARSYLRLRRNRDEQAPDLFADPAWDMLLDLFAASIEGRFVSVSSACIASGVPATTALRHIERMRVQGYVSRFKDGFDGRRILLIITPRGRKLVSRFLADLHAGR